MPRRLQATPTRPPIPLANPRANLGPNPGARPVLAALAAALLLAAAPAAHAQEAGGDPAAQPPAQDRSQGQDRNAERTQPLPQSGPELVIADLRPFDEAVVPRLGVTVAQLEEMPILGPNGEEIAEVEEVLTDSQNNIVAIVAEYGDFLGIFETQVVMRLDQLAVQSDHTKLTTPLSKEQLDELPEWDD